MVLPCGPLSHGGAAPAGWVPVHKRISRFSLAAGQVRARVTGPGAEPGCMVELTEVHRHRQAWWTLGFEASGPASLLRRELDVAATASAAVAMPSSSAAWRAWSMRRLSRLADWDRMRCCAQAEMSWSVWVVSITSPVRLCATANSRGQPVLVGSCAASHSNMASDWANACSAAARAGRIGLVHRSHPQPSGRPVPPAGPPVRPRQREESRIAWTVMKHGHDYAEVSEDYYNQRDRRNQDHTARHHQQALARLGYHITLVPSGDGGPPPAHAA